MEWEDAVEAHYKSIWGAEADPRQFSAGQIQRLPVDFFMLRFAPQAQRAMWVYATCGMSQAGEKKPTELHMFSPWASPEVEELLVVTAAFHRNSVALNVGDSVNFGRPWLRGSTCDRGLVSLPYLHGPKLENLQIGAELVKCYWLIPITSAEAIYKQENGLEALEQGFERAALNYLDPKRKCTVQ